MDAVDLPVLNNLLANLSLSSFVEGEAQQAAQADDGQLHVGHAVDIGEDTYFVNSINHHSSMALFKHHSDTAIQLSRSISFCIANRYDPI